MTTIKLKNGSGAPAGGDLTQGEPALDLTNKRLYTEDSGGNVIEVGTNPGTDVTFADNRKALFGTGSDLQIFHDGNHSYLKDAGTGDLYIQGEANVRITDGDGNKMFLGQNDGEVQLYYNGAEKLNTTATGIDVTGNASFGDNGKAIFGAGSDLQIYHDGTNSYIVNTTNDLIIGEDTRVRIKTPSLLVNNAADNENLLTATENGAVTLYYDNAAKLATSSTGIDVAGNMIVDAGVNGTIDFGNVVAAYGRLYADSTGTYVGSYTNHPLILRTNNTERMQIDTGGNAIFTKAGGAYLQLKDASAVRGAINVGTSDGLIFTTGASFTERMRLNSSGNLLVGKTVDDNTTVGFKVQSGGFFSAVANGTTTCVLNRLTSDGDIAVFRKDGATVGSIGTAGGDLTVNAQSLGALQVGGVSKYGWTGSLFYPTNDNTNDLGTSSFRFKDLHLSGTARASTYRLQSGSTTTGGLFHEKDITGSGSSVDTSVYAETGNAIHFMVNGSATPVGTFDTSGNFGIGTSNPANNGLHIEKSGTARLRLAQAGVRSWDMEATGGDWRLNNATNSFEAMRATSAGDFLVGTSSAPTGSTGGSGFITESVGRRTLKIASTTTSGAAVAEFINPNGVVGIIVTDGSTTSYNTSSDQRLKENIVDAPSASDEIDAIQVRSFDWKADGSHQKYGMVAQELQSVAPEAVSEGETEEDMMGVDYSKLVPMLVKEIQSLRARVAQLEND